QGAGTVQFGAVSSNNAVLCRFLNAPIVVPCLQCTTACTSGDCADNSDGTGTIRFSGSVTNCTFGGTPDQPGFLTIINVGVVSVVNGVTNVVLGSTNTILGVGVLNFAGSYR